MRQRKALFFIGVLLLCAKSYCLTLSDAETEVRRLIKDTATSVTLQRYSDTILDSFLNQAQIEVVTDTWCLQASTTVVLTAATTYYNLPTDLITIRLVRVKDTGNRTRNIYETSYKAMYENNPDFERQSGPPMQYIVRPSPSSNYFQIAFLPVATTSSTGTATIEYYKQAGNLNDDTANLLDGKYTLLPYHETVVYKAVIKIKLLEGDATGAATYSQLYSAMISAMNSRLGEKPNLNPGISGATSSSFSGGGAR